MPKKMLAKGNPMYNILYTEPHKEPKNWEKLLKFTPITISTKQVAAFLS